VLRNSCRQFEKG
jgi:hypothetical protein